MTFKQLIESGMTITSATGILGLDASYTQDDVKKAYRAKSKENHPDRGGSTEAMQQVNLAYELLEGTTKDKGAFDWNKVHKEYKDLCKHINTIIASSFKKTEFTSYFKEIFGQTFKVLNVKYLGEDYYKGKSKDQYGSPSYAGIAFTIESKDGNIVIDFRADVSLTNIKGSNGLSSGKVPSVPLSVVSTGFFAGRKFKLFAKSYNNTKIESFKFNDVEVFFPKAKLAKHLEKKKTSKATKKDFLSAITKILKGVDLDDDDTYACPVKNEDDVFMIISRRTFMRKGTYSINISKKDGWRYTPTNSSINDFYTFFEAPEFLDFVLSLKDKTAKQIETAVKKYRVHQGKQ